MGRQCNKCGYRRRPEDLAPPGECPRCGVVYAKVKGPAGVGGGTAVDLSATFEDDGEVLPSPSPSPPPTSPAHGSPRRRRLGRLFAVLAAVGLGAVLLVALRDGSGSRRALTSMGESVSLEELEERAASGDMAAASRLGRLLRREGPHQNLLKAREYLSRAAASGDARAQYELALMREAGEGGPADLQLALSALESCANAGYAPCQVRLGRMLLTGRGVSKDEVRAVQLFNRAATAGDPEGRYYLGKAYARGLGELPPDAPRAFLQFSQAARDGFLPALVALGRCYLEGFGTPINPFQAAQVWRQAALRGHSGAQRRLAELLADPARGPYAPIEAFAWSILVAGDDSERAAQLQASLRRELSDQQLEEARQKAVALREQIEQAAAP